MDAASTYSSLKAMSGYCFAVSRQTLANNPSVTRMTLALCMAVTFFLPLRRRAISKAFLAMRSQFLLVITRMQTVVSLPMVNSKPL